jgi:tetratricopeptide (TPR) repeat protein
MCGSVNPDGVEMSVQRLIRALRYCVVLLIGLGLLAFVSYRVVRRQAPTAGDTGHAVAPQSDPAEAHFLQAKADFESKNYEGAIAQCTEGIRLNPKRWYAYYILGDCHGFMKQFDEAIADYSRAIQLNPDFALLYLSRSGAYRAKGEYDSAVADCNRALEITAHQDTNSASDKKRALYQRAGIYYIRRDYDQAIVDQSELIRLDPQDSEGYANRAASYCMKGEYDRGIADWDEAIRLKPGTLVSTQVVDSPSITRLNTTGRSRILPALSKLIRMPQHPFMGGRWPFWRRKSLPKPSLTLAKLFGSTQRHVFVAWACSSIPRTWQGARGHRG